jgi:hypothetical protein
VNVVKPLSARVRQLFVNDLTLLALALPLSFLIGMAVRYGRFERVHPFLYQKHDMLPAEPHEVQIVRRAVLRASRVAPARTCLCQASLGKVLMNFIGREAVLHVGVLVEEQSTLRAHAWLSAHGMTIVGGPGAKIAPFRQIAQFR